MLSHLNPLSFYTIGRIVLKEMLFEEFQDSCYDDDIRYRNVNVLAFLNIHVAFHYGLVQPVILFGRCHLRRM